VEKDRARERVFRGFVRQRAPAAFQAGLTPRPSGSLVGALSFASPSRLAFPSSLPLRGRPLRLLTARAASALKSAFASAVANSSSTSWSTSPRAGQGKETRVERRSRKETSRRDSTVDVEAAARPELVIRGFVPFPFFWQIKPPLGWLRGADGSGRLRAQR